MTEKPEIVRHTPTEQSLSTREVVARALAQGTHREDEVRPREVWAAIRRNRWLILLCAVCAVTVAAFLTSRATPVYKSSATLKIEVKEPNLPGMFSLTEGSELGTEAEVLQSRTLAESAATVLSLQLRLLEPRRVARNHLFDSIRVAREAAPATYWLTRQPDGSYALLSDSLGSPATAIRPGETLQLPGLQFRLTPAAAAYETIAFSVLRMQQAALGLLGNMTVLPAGRDVNILTIEYEDTDQELVWLVPNTIVDRYLARRRDVARAGARTTAKFLREQLDTVSAQLAGAEDELRDYRERNRTIDPQIEGTTQVQRLISMQTERAALETERTALAKLLADVDAKAARRKPEEPTPYRELAAFPTLLRSQVATGVLQSLSEVEQQRATLLARRTENDPDVQVLTGRVKELEGQLRSVVVTYLQGLSNQVATFDASLEQFGHQLGTLPQRELEVARLERKPKVLDEIAAMLQTRLKEAEIAQAAGDPSVQVLDPAARPGGPFKPNRTANLFAGLLCGLLLGGVTTFVREYRDRTVHTRREIEIATGLPVLGLIPTIEHSRWSARRIPLITETARRRAGQIRTASPPPDQLPIPAPSGQRTPTRSTYTFFGTADSQDVGVEPPLAAESSLKPADTTLRPEAPIKPAAPVQVALTKAGSAAAEAYGVLQTNISFSFPDRSVRVVVVTSALPGEGKTTNAVNLALSLTRRGLRVLLIDADLRRGEVHTALEAPREPGLTEVLRGSIPLARVCRSIEIEGHPMHYLTTGAAVSSPTALLDSDAMRGLLDHFRSEYDIIVVDSPPTNIVTDAAVLGAMADGVILVARVGVTEAGALATAISQLRHVRASVIGVVLNDIDFKRDAAYDASYRYYNYGQYVSSTSS
jgi:capsular exopolysaccharide synthesis family protein